MPTSRCDRHDILAWGCSTCREVARGQESDTELNKQLILIQKACEEFESLIDSFDLPDEVLKKSYEFLDKLDRATEIIGHNYET